MDNYTEKLIIVEGLPCSGKSTTSKYIAELLNARAFDEGTGDHPADYEFHAFVENGEMNGFTDEEQKIIRSVSEHRPDGYIVPVGNTTGGLFDKLMRYKIYDGLPWETEMRMIFTVLTAIQRHWKSAGDASLKYWKA